MIFLFLFSCCVQAGTHPSSSSEIRQNTPMEEDNTQKEEPQEDGASDEQHVGENSLGVHFMLRDFQ